MIQRFKDGDMVLVRSQPYDDFGEIGIFIIDGNGYIKNVGTIGLFRSILNMMIFISKKGKTSDAKDLSSER